LATKRMSVAAGASQFEGFDPEALNFFKALAFHQSKEWFTDNRAIYETGIKSPLIRLIDDLSAKFAANGIPLVGHGERSIFRLHRDIRFSKDKSPYKTHAGATLTRDGGKLSPGLLYIHVAAVDSFAAAGFYRPQPPALAALREAIAADRAGWLRMEQSLEMAKLELSREDGVTRLPRGFDAEECAEVAEALKLKSFIVRRPLKQEALLSARLVDDLVDFAGKVRPLLDFGWSAIEKR
jgi:uncharacterized protein (TIGR02453 family)